MKIVFDTNIYLAAIMAADFCYELLQNTLRLDSGMGLYISEPILHELENKFREFQKVGQLSADRVIWMRENVMKLVVNISINEPINVIKDDPDDNKILECAVAAKADLIVSMDRHLLRLKTFRKIGIVHPKTFSFMFPRP